MKFKVPGGRTLEKSQTYEARDHQLDRLVNMRVVENQRLMMEGQTVGERVSGFLVALCM